MPTKSIKFKFLGSLLRDEARRCYDTRKRTMNVKEQLNSWTTFSEALVTRFADNQERRRDYDRIKSFKYEGSIC